MPFASLSMISSIHLDKKERCLNKVFNVVHVYFLFNVVEGKVIIYKRVETIQLSKLPLFKKKLHKLSFFNFTKIRGDVKTNKLMNE